MNKRQQRTLAHIFETPTRSDVAWSEVQSLLSACGAEIREGRGSRVRIVMNKQILNLHAPHHKEVKKYAIELIRDFLTNSGVVPS